MNSSDRTPTSQESSGPNRYGRTLFVAGMVLTAPGALGLLTATASLAYQAFSGAQVVPYAAYALEASAILGLVVSTAILVPGALLIKQGLIRIRNARDARGYRDSAGRNS